MNLIQRAGRTLRLSPKMGWCRTERCLDRVTRANRPQDNRIRWKRLGWCRGSQYWGRTWADMYLIRRRWPRWLWY